MIDEQLFDKKLATIKKRFRFLIECGPHRPEAILAKPPEQLHVSGVYVFSEQIDGTECFMYVGQSKKILNRLREHCGMKDRMMANFAYKLTVESTGLRPIPGSPNATKKSMFDNQEFKNGFEDSLCRIKRMNYRSIAVTDKLEKNLLKIFAAVTLGSKYNEFD